MIVIVILWITIIIIWFIIKIISVTLLLGTIVIQFDLVFIPLTLLLLWIARYKSKKLRKEKKDILTSQLNDNSSESINEV